MGVKFNVVVYAMLLKFLWHLKWQICQSALGKRGFPMPSKPLSYNHIVVVLSSPFGQIYTVSISFGFTFGLKFWYSFYYYRSYHLVDNVIGPIVTLDSEKLSRICPKRSNTTSVKSSSRLGSSSCHACFQCPRIIVQLLCLRDLTGTRGNSVARLLTGGWLFFTVMVLYMEVRSFLFYFQHWNWWKRVGYRPPHHWGGPHRPLQPVRMLNCSVSKVMMCFPPAG